MTALKQKKPPFRIAQNGFEPKEIEILHELLGKLEPYLRDRWSLSDPAECDVLFQCVDIVGLPRTERSRPAVVVGCARHPRSLMKPAVHRPIRASELLEVLNGYSKSQGKHALRASPSPTGLQPFYELVRWPLGAETLPPAWQRVLACISRNSRSVEEISHLSNVAIDEIQRCLIELSKQNLVSTQERAVLQQDAPKSRQQPRPAARMLAWLSRKFGVAG